MDQNLQLKIIFSWGNKLAGDRQRHYSNCLLQLLLLVFEMFKDVIHEFIADNFVLFVLKLEFPNHLLSNVISYSFSTASLRSC